MMVHARRGRGRRTAALVVLLVTVGLIASALADEAEPEGCCVCDCTEQATDAATSGRVRPEGLVCIEATSSACAAVCDLEGCQVSSFVENECSSVPGCAQAPGTMAPVASPLLLGAIAAALAALGIYATRRRRA